MADTVPMSLPPPSQEPGSDEPEGNPHRLRWLIAAVVIVGLAVGVVAIVGSGSGSAETSYTAGESCTSADVEANVRLTVYSSSGRSACEAVDRALGRQGSYWRVQPSGAELEGELVCSLAKEHTLVEVRDTGGHVYGNHFCAFFTGKDWTEREGPGSQIERERAKHETEAKEARERREHEEEAERQRTQAAERTQQEAKEKVEHAKEAAERKHEEAKQNSEHEHEEAEHSTEAAHEQAEEHVQEDQEHKEQQKQEAESRKQLQQDEEENARDNKRNEEETKRATQEAQNSE
jgi:hypothetical protein